jgi:hypothetical protein
MSKQLMLVLWIEDGLTNPVKAITKDAPGGSLMFLQPNRCDRMSPRTNMIRPAKRHGEHGK